MQVVFITRATSENIGTAKRAFKMAPHLARMGVETKIIINDISKNRKRVGRLDDIEGVYVDAKNIVASRNQKYNRVKAINPDVVHTNGISLRNMFSLDGVFRVVEHAELYSYSEDETLQSRAKHFAYEWASFLIADGIVAASKDLKNFYERRATFTGLNTPFIYLPYGYNEKYTNTNKKEQKYFENNTILYFGSLSRNYGFFDLIDSVHILNNEQGVDANLVFAGSGNMLERLNKYAKKKKIGSKVDFSGFIAEEDVPKYINGADVLVSPLEKSNRDKYRCPSKVPMYMSSGNPIVTCQIGEVGRCLGDDGFYYEPGNVHSMANALRRALGSGKVDYDRSVLNSYDWKNISRKFANWLDERIAGT